MKTVRVTRPQNASVCDWEPPEDRGANAKGQKVKDNSSRIYTHKGDFRWSGVAIEKYKQVEGGWSDILRTVLIGNHGETCKFHLRYFEIGPNGYSSLERHRHEHVVVCVRGRGKIRIGKKTYSLNYLDTAYVAPNTVHQLTNPYDEPFGFFCVVNAKRDKPKAIKLK